MNHDAPFNPTHPTWSCAAKLRDIHVCEHRKLLTKVLIHSSSALQSLWQDLITDAILDWRWSKNYIMIWNTKYYLILEGMQYYLVLDLLVRLLSTTRRRSSLLLYIHTYIQWICKGKLVMLVRMRALRPVSDISSLDERWKSPTTRVKLHLIPELHSLGKSGIDSKPSWSYL